MTRGRAWLALSVLGAACGRHPLVSPGTDAGPSLEAGVGDRDAGASLDGDDAPRETGPTASATLPNGRCVPFATTVDGVCLCVPDRPSVCGDGCTDTNADEDNCGACGNKCAETVTCRRGVCGPAPKLVRAAPPTCASTHLTTDGETLFWTDESDGTVRRMSVTGQTATVVVSAEDHPRRITSWGNTLFWAAGRPADRGGRSDAAILGVTIRTSTGQLARTIASWPTGIFGFDVAPDGLFLYFSTGDTIQRVSLFDGKAPVVVATAASNVFLAGVTIVDSKLVALDLIGGKIWFFDLHVAAPPPLCGLRAPDTGASLGDCHTFSSDNGYLLPDTVLGHGTFAYWGDAGGLKRHDLSDQQAGFSFAARARGEFINAMAIDVGDHALVIGSHDQPFDIGPSPTAMPPANSGVIELLPLTLDATPRALARGQARPISIASDGVRVFWSTDRCEIFATTR